MLEKLKAALKGVTGKYAVSAKAKDCVKAIFRESHERGNSLADRIKLSGLPTWDNLKTSDETLQIEVALYCADNDQHSTGMGGFRSAIATQLLRKKLPYDAHHLTALIVRTSKQSYFDIGLPIASILSATEHFCENGPPEGKLKLALQHLKLRIDASEVSFGETKFNRKLKDRIAAILQSDRQGSGPVLPPGDWTDALEPWLKGLAPVDHDAWMQLLVFAANAGDKSKPSKKWLSDAEQLVDAIGKPAVTAQLSTWLSSTTPDPTQIDNSLDVLKGLIWMTAFLEHETVAPAIGRFAEVCFRKVPDYGARSVKLGNACIASLGAMKGCDAAVAELVRLKTRIKYGSVRDLVAKRLAEAAEDTGVSVADLEESALPDFGFDLDGRQDIQLGDAMAVITLDGESPVLSWLGADGKPRKAPPVSVKRDYPDELKVIKQKVKDIGIAWGVQVVRLEASWVEGRSWALDVWRNRYLDHPLRRQIIKTLVWRFEEGGRSIDAMIDENGFIGLDGKAVTVPPDGTVRLWHPLDADPDDVLAWRRRIVSAGMTQSIKQAHREIYVLTDAERSTEIYSNRFAAHILRQHQFRALCHARGWAYDLQGSWDSHNIPARPIPQRNLVAEYHVEAIENDERSDAWIPLHLATDQVRIRTMDGEPLNLDAVPPIVFSELLRDVDLFVAVTSVANDPDWVDGGPEGQYGTYWHAHAFGDLSQTATTRRDLIAEIVPKLTIANKLNVSGKFLEVQGKRHDYRIHLGSSNIQIMPGNRYLCIVRGSTPKDRQTVRLPFTGDNLLSIILSKAFMLVNDDKITDKTILSQLEV